MPDPLSTSDLSTVLPASADALLVGRLEDPELGPCLVTVRGEQLVDITASGPTMSDLLDRAHLAQVVRLTPATRTWHLPTVLTDSMNRVPGRPRLLAPVDLSAVKAAGVTFAKSMVERVVEENAKGDPGAAQALRERLGPTIAAATKAKPGSPEAAAVKQDLIAAGLWSQYLEVGIGPDPEIFTKAQPLSSVGFGAHVGVLERSTWNNPEPEVVLACTSSGQAVGACLGNDVNLRDFEGRSALLLAEAKDNNASCAIGPFLRLFTEDFTIEDLRTTEVSLRISGEDGFELTGVSRVAEMSRTFEELITHCHGPHHQYPDGFVLFTGTMFAPTQDRDAPGEGFTHHAGDRVFIQNDALGCLINEVTTAESAPPWTFGIRELMANLSQRGLLQ